jgi:glycosyltransferase involved in cell wall biosynthesis
LKRTIESVASQDYKDIEYIVVDGVSTDGSLELIKQNHPKFIDKFISEKDRGIYDAMNKGIEMASGDFIYFLNSDDTLYNSEVIKNVVEGINQNPKYDYYYGGVISKNMFGSNSSNIFLKEIPNRSIKSGQNIRHQSLFVRKELFKQLGLFSLDYKVNSDYEWECRLVKNGKLGHFLNIIIANYNQTGFSSKGTWSQYREKISIIRKYFGFFAGFIYAIKSVFKFSSVYILKRTGLAKYVSKFLNRVRGTNIKQ